MPQVTVTQYVKNELKHIQRAEEHTSMDSVLRMLIRRAGYTPLEDEIGD